jgi:hypothetical protein
MTKAIVVLAAATLFAGCASTREQRAAAFQHEVPHLVATCNASFGEGGPRTREGKNACGRLANKKSLDLVDPTAARAYTSYANSRKGTGLSNAGSVRNSPSPIQNPGGSTQQF